MVLCWQLLAAILSLYLVQPTEADTEAKGLKVLRFEASEDGPRYITFTPASGPTNWLEITVCAWVKPEADDKEMYWFDLHDTFFEYKAALWWEGAGDISIDTIQDEVYVTGRVTVDVNTWSHTCQVLSAAQEVRVYSDGVLLESEEVRPLNDVTLEDDRGIKVGSDFVGELTKVTVFSRPLGGDEIEELYNGGRCSEVEMNYDTDIAISWETIVGAHRSGSGPEDSLKVKEIVQCVDIPDSSEDSDEESDEESDEDNGNDYERISPAVLSKISLLLLVYPLSVLWF